MGSIMYIILESLLLVLALSTDALIASLAYGSNQIKIPWSSAQIIALICSGILGLSLCMGTLLKSIIPDGAVKYISFGILIFLGLTKLMDNIVKALISKHTVFDKRIKFTMFNLNFILNIYANPNEADLDQSKTLSPKEAMTLALALSLDSLAAGFGAAMGNVNILAVILLSIILSVVFIKFGEFIGYRISSKIPFISWLGGVLLIAVAFLRII